MDILVRAFANVSGLGAALERDGRLKEASQLRAFATGFSRRQAFFDFVDIGNGKERADLKVRGKTHRFLFSLFFFPMLSLLLYSNSGVVIENIKFFLESFQCKHLVLACGHDSGYAPFLGQFVGDKHVAERITLLEGSPFPAAIKDLGLKKTQFSSVFSMVTQPSLARPAWGRGVVMSTVAESFADHGSNTGRPVAVGPVVPKTPLAGCHKPQAQSGRLGPVLRDQDGRRVDRPLQVNQEVLERIKKGGLCYYLFLRGDCVSPMCKRNHVHRALTDEEFDALCYLARQGRCHQNLKADRGLGIDCSDVLCVYSHKGKEM